MLSVGIVGGGKEGFQYSTGGRMQGVSLRWVADLDENAPAIQRAREMGIKISSDFIPCRGFTWIWSLR